MAELKPKQKAFADHYIELGNAEQAAIKAGYSERYARGNAYKLIANNGIKKYIEERMQQKDNERIASQDEVLEFLTRVLRGEEVEQVPISTAKEIQLIEKTPSIKDRTKAAELLGKRYAIFTDKVEHSGDMGINIKIDYGDEDDDS